MVSGASPPLNAVLDHKLVAVTVDPNATSVTITASQATGSDTLHLVDANGARADIAIRVAFNAGTIVPEATLDVTGSPAGADWLMRQVDAFVARLTRALPGTQTQIGQTVVPVLPLAPGEQTQFSIPVSVTSPTGTYFDQTGTTVVNVENVPVDPFDPALLFYDDDPEKVSADGVLFRGTVTAAQPARLYYYHVDVGGPRNLIVAVGSDSQDPTSVQLIDTVAGPNEDVMHVGNVTTRTFLVTKQQGEGVIVNLSQDAPYFVHDATFGNGQLVAGTLDVRVMSGGPAVVTVMAVSPGTDPLTIVDQPPLPGDGHHRTGVFRIAGYGNETLAYTAGGPDASVTIGDRQPTPPRADPTASGHDYGDYGVIHTIDLTLANPGAAPATAYLYFKPLAGDARASFLVNGAPAQIGCVRQPLPYEVAPFTLTPGQTSHVRVQTMTDGGSNYPVQVGVTATPPQPSAPPLFAPDGCFPKPALPVSPLSSPAPPSPLPSASPAAAPSPSPSSSPLPGPTP
jgi:hypothetical protein